MWFTRRELGRPAHQRSASVIHVFIIGTNVGILVCSPVKKLTALKAHRESNSTTVNTSVIFNLSSTMVISWCFPSYPISAAWQSRSRLITVCCGSNNRLAICIAVSRENTGQDSKDFQIIHKYFDNF